MLTVPWFDFKNPDYGEVYANRLMKVKKINEDEYLQKCLYKFYKDHPIEFIEDWMVTYDPRTEAKYLPFILFPRQEEYILWLKDKYEQKEDGLIEKSRDAGATWLNCAFATWKFIFEPGVAVGFGSRKENLVDRLGDADSIFEKIRIILKFLPDFIRPKYDPAYLKIRNLDNGAIISGEGGDNIGRGGRKSIYFKDESAHYERADKIDAALSQNSPCKIDVSTPNGTGNLFYQKRVGGAIDVFTFHWSQDPRKDQTWYEKEKAKTPSHIFAQEVEIDYHSAVAGLMFKPEWIRACIGFDVGMPFGMRVAMMDVADEGGDENTLTIIHGRSVTHIEAWKEGNTTQNTRKANHICGDYGVDIFRYDNIGVGSGVKGELNSLEEQGLLNFQKVVPFDARSMPTPGYYIKPSNTDPKGRRNRDMFANLRAEGWWKLSDMCRKTWEQVNGIATYDSEEMLSLPDDPKYKQIIERLISELCSVKYGFNGKGQILVESKKDMTIASPNLADGLIAAAAPIKPSDLEGTTVVGPLGSQRENPWSKVPGASVSAGRKRNLLSSPYYPRG